MTGWAVLRFHFVFQRYLSISGWQVAPEESRQRHLSPAANQWSVSLAGHAGRGYFWGGHHFCDILRPFLVRHPPLGCAHITRPGEMAYKAGAHVLRRVPDSGPSWPEATKATTGPQWLIGSPPFMRKIPSELCCSVGSRSEVNMEAGDPTGLRQSIGDLGGRTLRSCMLQLVSRWPQNEEVYLKGDSGKLYLLREFALLSTFLSRGPMAEDPLLILILLEPSRWQRLVPSQRFRVIPWLPGRCERPVQVHYTHSGWSGDVS